MKKLSAVILVLALALTMAFAVSAAKSPIAPLIPTGETTKADETTTRWVTPTYPDNGVDPRNPSKPSGDEGTTSGGKDDGKVSPTQPGYTARPDTNPVSPSTGSASAAKTAAAVAAVLALGAGCVYVSRSKKED